MLAHNGGEAKEIWRSVLLRRNSVKSGRQITRLRFSRLHSMVLITWPSGATVSR
jgi:hypothetical protein